MVEMAWLTMDNKRTIIKNMLTRYKTQVAIIDIAKQRIGVLVGLLSQKNLDDYILVPSSMANMLGSIRAPGFNITSPVLAAVIKKEEQDEEIKLTREHIEKLIKNEQNKISGIESDVKIMDYAMQSLSKSERFILKCRYLEGEFWAKIEMEYNERYRGKNYVGIVRLKKIRLECIDKLVAVIYN